MAVHRTKEQKKRAEVRRQESAEQISFQYAGGQPTIQKKSKINAQILDERTAFLKKDLLHSLVVSAIMMLCFVGIYSYLRYNNMSLVSVLF